MRCPGGKSKLCERRVQFCNFMVGYVQVVVESWSNRPPLDLTLHVICVTHGTASATPATQIQPVMLKVPRLPRHRAAASKRHTSADIYAGILQVLHLPVWLFVAGATFGEVGASFFVACEIFGDVGVSLFMACAAFGGVDLQFWEIARARHDELFHTECVAEG